MLLALLAVAGVDVVVDNGCPFSFGPRRRVATPILVNVDNVLLSSSAIAITICEKTDKDSTSLTMDGIPATGNRCLGVSFVVIGKRRLPCDDAKTTAQARGYVLKNGGVIS